MKSFFARIRSFAKYQSPKETSDQTAPASKLKDSLRIVGIFALLSAHSLTAAQPAEQTLFAFDDHSIPWQHNLKLTLVEAEKHPGNPVLRRGPKDAPDHGHAILYGTVIKDGDKFRMWYLGMFETELKAGQAPGWWRPMCYAESADGVHWTKPNLGLMEFKGNKNNNICLVEGEPFSLTKVNDFLSVLHEPDDPDPARRYKAVYIAHPPYDDIKGGMSPIGPKERVVAATILATSADGLSWKVVGDRPANAEGERFEVSSLYRFGDSYYSTGQLASPWAWRPDGSKVGRVMLGYRSTDFDHWSQAKAFSFARPGQLTEPPIKGQQTHMGAGLWNRGNVLVGLYGMWQDAPAPPPKGAKSWNEGVTIDLGLVLSNDGIHFREPVPDFKIIPRGKPGEWDDIALLQGHAFVNEGDQTMIWYSHWDTGGRLKDMEIGLATLRRDGFGYLSRQFTNTIAHCVTSPLSGKELSLFANAENLSAKHPLRIELLDERDRPIRGYSGKHAALVSKAGVREPVIWPLSKSPRLPAEKELSVKITFPGEGDARLFALYPDDEFNSNPPSQTIQKMQTDEGVEFGVWGRREGKRQPVLIVLGGTIDSILSSAYFRQCGNLLSENSGWLCVSIDLPCHGKQIRKGETSGLTGWRNRVEKGEDFVAPFNARLSQVLDHLIKAGIADPDRIAASGTSRGGYHALQFAASDKRVGAAAAFAPVTDLAALREFSGMENNELTRKLSAAQQGAALAGRPVWICIGDQDARVSTERVVDCARQLSEAKAQVALHVTHEPRGHTTPKGSAKLAAAWIESVFQQ